MSAPFRRTPETGSPHRKCRQLRLQVPAIIPSDRAWAALCEHRFDDRQGLLTDYLRCVAVDGGTKRTAAFAFVVRYHP